MRSIPVLSLVVIIVASGFLLYSQPTVHAQYSPPVPEFTLTFDNESYAVPATTTTPAQYVTKDFIDVIIKNTGEYTYYAVVNESVVKLYYNIRVKDHNQTWTNCTISPNLAPSNSNYTTVKFGLGTVNPDPGGFSIWIGNITNGNQVDFQVQALLGFYTKLTQENPPCWRLSQFSIFNETGASGWSDTQTINTLKAASDAPAVNAAPNLNANAASKTITPTTLVLIAFASVISVLAIAVIHLKRQPASNRVPAASSNTEPVAIKAYNGGLP